MATVVTIEYVEKDVVEELWVENLAAKQRRACRLNKKAEKRNRSASKRTGGWNGRKVARRQRCRRVW